MKKGKRKERKKGEKRKKREKKKKGRKRKKGRKKEKGVFFVELGLEQKLPLDERRAPAATAPARSAAAPRRRRPGA